MALEHALLVSLREHPAAGLELARRFDKSIGFFWSATHQQIYKVLGRMTADGWVSAETTPQEGKREKTVYSVTPLGETVLAEWIAKPSPTEKFRSEVAVKMRGASYGDREALRLDLREQLAEHRTRLAHYEQLRERDYPDHASLDEQDLDHYLVLRGGVLLEQFWIDWLSLYLKETA
ncbi:MAG: PadR family transcriptional regulator [Proteobacteria bacterium]|nr:MAG: PadR family transcriptional regulator [Pseudomonadota bacterium]